MVSLANLTLQKRIGLLVLASLAIGLGLFSWLGVQSVNESVERTLSERLTMARMMASHLDETLTYVLAQVQNAANLNDGLPTKEQFDSMADSLLVTFGNLGISTRNIILIDRDSKVIQVEPEDSGITGADMFDHPTVKKALEEGLPTISGLVSSPLIPVPVVLISAPIINEEGEIIGVLTSAIDIKQSRTGTFSPTVTVGETGYTEIVDGNGVVLTRTKPGSPPEVFEMSDHPTRFAELITQGKATVGICHRCHETEEALERRRDVLAFAPLSTTSWGVAIRQSEEEALAPTRQLEQRLLFLGIIVLISTFLLVWVTMQGIVKPVRMLTAAVQRVAAGDFEAATPVKRQDEIGQLSTAFYAMTQQLAKSRDELVLRNEELRAYAAYVIRAQEVERQRIARELHDGTIQSLILLCRQLDGLQGTSESESSSLNDVLREARGTAEEVVNELRDVTKALRPPILDDLGMVTSIRRLLADFTERTKIKSQPKVLGEERRLLSDEELGMFRIAQEALRNVERHAEATHVAVTITFAKHETRLKVVDNGVGFSMASPSGNVAAGGQMGLRSMQERAELLGGKLEIQSSPGNGTTVIVSVPVADADDISEMPAII